MCNQSKMEKLGIYRFASISGKKHLSYTPSQVRTFIYHSGTLKSLSMGLFISLVINIGHLMVPDSDLTLLALT